MLRKKIIVLLFAISLFVTRTSFGQTHNDSSNVPILTADSLASGNYKDILSSFYQLAIDNLTGPNKDLKFTTNPYAIMLKNDSTLKKYDKYRRYQVWRRFNLALDAQVDSAYHFSGLASGLTYALVNRRDYSMRHNFVTLANESGNDTMFSRLGRALSNRVQHHQSFAMFDDALREKGLSASDINDEADKAAVDAGFRQNEEKLMALTLDSTLKFRSISSDKQLIEADRQVLLKENTKLYKDRIVSILGEIAQRTSQPNDIGQVQKYFDGYQRAARTLKNSFSDKIGVLENDTSLTFNKVDPQFRAWIFQDVENADPSVKYLKMLVDSDSTLIVAKQSHKGYDSLVASFGLKGLWTVGVSDTSYPNGHFFKNVKFYSEYLKGAFHPSKLSDLELDLKAAVNFQDDSLHTGRNLQRQYWTAEPGVNLVFKGRKTGLSFFEFKLSGSITHVFKGYYSDNKNLDITLNGTIRLRIFNEIWLPLLIKYDPQTGNVFGFLNVTTNFTSLSSLVKGSKK